MDDLFGKIDCRSKSDAIVMRLLKSAMDKAHDKVQCMNGPMEFLHERSKFYELAAILVEGGLNIVQEEEDMHETSREKILSDLMEIKDWLQRRNEEMKLLIMEKDKELMERMENELKLSHTLELNERELVYLREKLELERNKSEDLQDFLQSSQEIQDGEKGGDIQKLKSSVDQQVLNIKQKLEEERKSITSRTTKKKLSNASDSELYWKLLDEDRSPGARSMEEGLHRDDHFAEITPLNNTFRPGKYNTMIQQMSSDIDILKGTLDLAFGRMQSVEVLPLEKQWRWTIEKDTILVSVKGFISDTQQILNDEFKKRDYKIPGGFFREKWTELVKDIRALRNELNAVCSQNKVEEKRFSIDERSCPSSQIRRTSSEPLLESAFKLPDEDPEPDGSRYVARMIKNHESIIQKHCEQWNWLTSEILLRRGPSSARRDKEPYGFESRIQKVITRLDNLIRWNDNLGDEKGLYVEAIPKASTMMLDKAAPEKLSARYRSHLSEKISKLKEDRDDVNLQIWMMEEIYLVLLKGIARNLDVGTNNLSLKDFTDEQEATQEDNKPNTEAGELEELTFNILPQYLESAVREDIYTVYLQETVKHWKKNMEVNDEEHLVKEDGYKIVPGESTSQTQVDVEGCEIFMANIPSISMFPETFGSLLREDIYMVYFRELSNAWRTERDDYDIKILIRDDMFQFVIIEAVKEAREITRESETLEQTNVLEGSPSVIKLNIDEGESLIAKLDSLLKCYEEDGFLMVDTSNQTDEHKGNDDLIVKFDSVVENDSMDSMEWLWADDENIFSAASEKLETALDQLHTSKTILLDMEQNLGMSTDPLKQDGHHSELNSVSAFESEREHISCQIEESELLQMNRSVFSPLWEFQQVLTDFENMAHKNLELKCLRLEELKLQIATLVQPVASIMKTKLLYKKAFIVRCHNLQLAENEVDLLANQLDKLLGILQKIYLVLDRNSTELSHYFAVYDILNLIKLELAKGTAYTLF